MGIDGLTATVTGAGLEATALTLTLFPFFSLVSGSLTAAASRNSVKLNFRNASNRRRSGAA
jgi:hypothetical protein